MPNTYHQIYIQTVFAVKSRKALIGREWKTQLCGVIGNLINEAGCKTLIVNGVEDHIHCFFSLKSSISVSEVMKTTKAKSSKWINESAYLSHRFEWQRGFGAFSYSKSHIHKVIQYIQNKEAHHKKQSFLDEYREFLVRFDVDYDEAYIFHEPF